MFSLISLMWSVFSTFNKIPVFYWLIQKSICITAFSKHSKADIVVINSTQISCSWMHLKQLPRSCFAYLLLQMVKKVNTQRDTTENMPFIVIGPTQLMLCKILVNTRYFTGLWSSSYKNSEAANTEQLQKHRYSYWEQCRWVMVVCTFYNKRSNLLSGFYLHSHLKGWLDYLNLQRKQLLTFNLKNQIRWVCRAKCSVKTVMRNIAQFQFLGKKVIIAWTWICSSPLLIETIWIEDYMENFRSWKM